MKKTRKASAKKATGSRKKASAKRKPARGGMMAKSQRRVSARTTPKTKKATPRKSTRIARPNAVARKALSTRARASRKTRSRRQNKNAISLRDIFQQSKDKLTKLATQNLEAWANSGQGAGRGHVIPKRGGDKKRHPSGYSGTRHH